MPPPQRRLGSRGVLFREDGILPQRRGMARAARLGADRANRKAPPGEVEVVYQHKNGRKVSAHGSLNVAVCRAALKVREQS
jgi:hypothetical protein